MLDFLGKGLLRINYTITTTLYTRFSLCTTTGVALLLDGYCNVNCDWTSAVNGWRHFHPEKTEHSDRFCAAMLRSDMNYTQIIATRFCSN